MSPRSFFASAVVRACLSGGLLALAYPAADAGVVAFVALVPLLLSLRGAAPGEAARRGALCGAVFFTALLYWIPGVMRTYGGFAWVAAWLTFVPLVAYLSGYVALFAFVVAWSWRRAGGVSLLMAPCIWVALELARARLLSGFPWGLLGYSQYRNLELLQASAWGGIYVVSWAVLAANAGIALLLATGAARRERWAGATLLALVTLLHGAGLWSLRTTRGTESGNSVEVAAVQANVAQDRKWSAGAAAAILSDLLGLTREARGAALIVWPESSSPYSFRHPDRPGTSESVVADAVYAGAVGDTARALDATLIVGSVDYAPTADGLRAFNSAFVVEPGAPPGPSYDKMHLVPFGEYVPLHRLLFFVDRLAQGAIADFAAGTRRDPLPTRSGRAATFICYEAIFPELVRGLAGRGADFLVNITNDAWFGTTAAPAQHLAMAAVRAAENRRWMVRAANTGISAIVDPTGRIVAQTPLMQARVLRGALRTRRDVTPYTAHGDVLAWGCAILALLHCAALRAAFPRRG